ncbi:hypothetical protein Tsubulata_032053 [Turnera subulata]|uniref:MADS-box domain-containing protein n=1 Tax=Turnera subulata TaxID=218843 RepID=A0A9Q0F6V8_9ROSI|nr:hypothetical protein Tsubulata_032053 [Turnera subulata]
MGRKKVTMELISNERTRMVTYHKRMKGLMKKMEEFHVLCDVDACMIIIGPKSKHGPAAGAVETWPPDRDEMKRIINRYRDKGSSIRMRKTQNLSDYFAARKQKVVDEVARLRKAKMEARFPRWHAHFDLLSVQQLKALDYVLDVKLGLAERRLLEMKCKRNQFLMDEIASASATGNIGAPIFPHLGPTPSNYDHKMMVPFNANPTFNPMMMMQVNGTDSTQFAGMTSNINNVPCSPIKDPASYYPMAPLGENALFNFAAGAYTMSYGGPSLPLLPYGQPPMSLSVFPQFSETCEVKGFEEDRTNGRL